MDPRLEKIIMYGMPVWAFLLFFAFHNFNIVPRALIKTTALTAVVVVGITFLIGPLSKFVKAANRYKIYRKYLGLSAFVLMLIHAILPTIFYYGLDVQYMLSFDNPRALQLYSALVAFVIFLLMALTSNQKAIMLLGGRNWKLLQTSGYIAMAFVILHFMLANTDGGVFRIGRLYASAVFVFGVIVILARILVLVLVSFERKASMKR